MAELHRVILLFLITITCCSSNPLESGNKETTTLCPEELAMQTQKQIEEEIDLQKDETMMKELADNINRTEDERMESTTTMCPEELEKLKMEQETTTMFSDEIESKITEDAKNLQINEIQMDDKRFENVEAAASTIIPEENNKNKDVQQQLPNQYKEEPFLLKIKEEHEANGENELSAKTLLNVQKDSALLKLVQNKFEVRTKRQTQNYSPYYSSQAVNSYNPPPGLSSTFSENNNDKVTTNNKNNQPKQQTSYNPTGLLTYSKVRQPQRQQHQSLYPNYVKPVKGFQNAVYRRYPSKNYYKNKGPSRRQFQASSTTFRSTRATYKKKFRPSPVFV